LETDFIHVLACRAIPLPAVEPARGGRICCRCPASKRSSPSPAAVPSMPWPNACRRGPPTRYGSPLSWEGHVPILSKHELR